MNFEDVSDDSHEDSKEEEIVIFQDNTPDFKPDKDLKKRVRRILSNKLS